MPRTLEFNNECPVCQERKAVYLKCREREERRYAERRLERKRKMLRHVLRQVREGKVSKQLIAQLRELTGDLA